MRHLYTDDYPVNSSDSLRELANWLRDQADNEAKQGNPKGMRAFNVAAHRIEKLIDGAAMSDDIPACAHPDGHAWVSGRAYVADEETRTLRILSRQCRRCGYEDVFDDHECERDDDAEIVTRGYFWDGYSDGSIRKSKEFQDLEDALEELREACRDAAAPTIELFHKTTRRLRP